MTDCNPLFQRQQDIAQEEKQLWEAETTMEIQLRQAKRWTSGDMDPEELRRAAEAAGDYVDLDSIQEAIARGLDTFAPVAIGEGQPTNYRMLFQRFGNDMGQVEDYAQLHQLVIGGNKAIDPDDYIFLTQTWDKNRIVDALLDAYSTEAGLSRDALNQMVTDTAPFATLVEKATRVRALSDGFQAGYLKLVQQAAEAMESAGSVPKELQAQILDTFGYTMAASRNFDLVRRRTAQTLRMFGIEIEERNGRGLPPLTAADVEERLATPFTEVVPPEAVRPTAPRQPGPIEGSSTPIEGSSTPTEGGPRRRRRAKQEDDLDLEDLLPEEPPTIEAGWNRGARQPSLIPGPEILDPKSHAARVMQAINDGRTNPERSAQLLRDMLDEGRIRGLDPSQRFPDPDDYINHMLKYGNGLAKDAMLTQVRTHLGLNMPSNALMALYGPYRELYRNMALITHYGAEVNRSTVMAAMKANWSAYGDAITQTFARGRHVFGDAFHHGRNIYSSNQDLQSAVDLNTRTLEPNEVEKSYQRQMLKLEVPLDSPGDIPRQVAASWGKVQAAWRIFLMDRGVPIEYTRIGHRLAGAVDNVGGFFFHNFKLRNDLYMEARLRAGELGLNGERDIKKWVDARAEEEFAHYRPTETEVKQYRKDNQLGAEVTDFEIAAEIADVRTAEAATNMTGGADMSAPGYWAPRTDTELSQRAAEFSSEMRFTQNRTNPIARGVGQVRAKWWGDAVAPFYQVPLNGSLLDTQLIRDVVPPIFGLKNWGDVEKLPARQRATMMANWVMAAHVLGAFVALDALDGNSESLVIGSGPMDPDERREWMVKLNARGLSPNTIAGVPVSGLPILNTVMLWKDIKESRIGGEYNDSDQASILTGLGQVLAAQISRTPGVAQVKQVMDMLSTASPGYGNRTASIVGFTAGSFFNPVTGMTRQVGRWMGTRQQDAVREQEPTQQQKDIGVDWDNIKRTEEWLKGIAYSAAPPLLAAAKRWEFDHLGNKVRRPWGNTSSEALRQAFFPEVWPPEQARLYAELDRFNKLRPPTPLMLGSLQGVRMSPDLRLEYRDALAGTRGDPQAMADMKLVGMAPKVDFTAIVPVDVGRGIRMKYQAKITNFPLGLIISSHVDGKTRLEAYRSFVRSDVYESLVSVPDSAGKPIKDQAEGVAKTILDGIDRYYQERALATLNISQSPAAQEWRREREKLEAVRNIQNSIKAFEQIAPGIMRAPQ